MATPILKYKYNHKDEINFVLSTLASKKSTFMIPTVLSNFRKGINPIKANYQYLQIALVTENCKYKSWFLTHIKETNMIIDMLNALNEDLMTLTMLKQKYKCMKINDDSTLMLDKMYKDFYNIKNGLEEYI